MLRNANVELRSALDELDALTRKATLTPQQQNRQSYLLSNISVLKSHGADRGGRRGHRGPEALSAEMRAFCEFLSDGEVRKETRDMLEGTQGYVSWTQGASGGYLVPQEYQEEVLEGMAQFDPLLDEENVKLDVSLGEGPLDQLDRRLPTRVVGWDLSTISAALISEGSQSTLVNQPAIASDTLENYVFRAILRGSFAFEQDAYPSDLKLMRRAYEVGFARGIGKKLLAGSGNGEPQGLLTAAANSGYTTSSNVPSNETTPPALSWIDFSSIYFSVNAAYRASPKCAWVMNDVTYQLACQAVDPGNRLVLNMERGEGRIFGKRVLVSPSMPSGAGSKAIVFGDLSHFEVRLSRMSVRRATETVSTGGYLSVDYIGLMRADSALIDPTGGTTPPIVYATLHN
jgi:HK97 family phage major capsid protein